MEENQISWSINRRDDELAKGMCGISNIKEYIKNAQIHFPTEEERQAKFEALEKERRQLRKIQLKKQEALLAKQKEEKLEKNPALISSADAFGLSLIKQNPNHKNKGVQEIIKSLDPISKKTAEEILKKAENQQND